MTERRVATTNLELTMLLLSFAGLIVMALLDDLDRLADTFYYSYFGSFIVLPVFLYFRKRWSWILALLYFLYMFVLTLLLLIQHPIVVTFVYSSLFLFLVIATLSENERIIHKVFI